MLGIRGEIADGGKSAAGHYGIDYDVNVFVNLSRLKTAVQMDVPVRGNQLSIYRMRELPLGAENHSALPVTRVPHREHVVGILSRSHRILDPTNVAEDQVSKGNLLHRFRGAQIAAQQTRNRRPIIFRDRRSEPQCIWSVRVPLPPQANNRESAAQQPRIAGVVCQVLITAIHEGKNARASAIGDFQQHRTIAFAGILRTDCHEVRLELDLAIPQVLGIAEIDNARVIRIVHGERKVDAPCDPLVGTHIAK